MNKKVLGLLSVAFFTAPVAVNAQTETLVYTGSPFTNLSINGNLSNGLANSVLANTGDLVLSSPLGDNLNNVAVTPVSWSFDASSQFGAVYLNSKGPFAGGPGESASFIFSTDANGVPTAWSANVIGGILFGTNTTSFAAFTIGNGGDSFSSGLSSPICAAPPGIPTPCFSVQESNSVSGSWNATVAPVPEIDPTSAVTGLSILLGGVAVLRGRRKHD